VLAIIKPVKGIANAMLLRLGHAFVLARADARYAGQFFTTLATLTAAIIVSAILVVAIGLAVCNTEACIADMTTGTVPANTATPVVTTFQVVANGSTGLCAAGPWVSAWALDCVTEAVTADEVVTGDGDAFQEFVQVLLPSGKSLVIAILHAILVAAARGHAIYRFSTGLSARETLGKELEALIEQALADATVVVPTVGNTIGLSAMQQLCVGLLRLLGAEEETACDASIVVGRTTAGALGHLAAGFMGNHATLGSADIGRGRVNPGIAMPLLGTSFVRTARGGAEYARLKRKAEAAGTLFWRLARCPSLRLAGAALARKAGITTPAATITAVGATDFAGTVGNTLTGWDTPLQGCAHHRDLFTNESQGAVGTTATGL